MFSWTVDSGATDHITPFVDLLTNVRPIKSVIHLPTGQTSLITHIGNIIIDKHLKVLALKKEIQIGSLDVVVYKLHANNLSHYSFPGSAYLLVSSCHNVCNKSSTSLWHARLGHIPLTVLKQLPIDLYCSEDSHCDICHYDKQTRVPFPLGDSKSSSKFSLIHCDIWGPYRHFTHGKCYHFLTIVDDYSRCTRVFLFHDKSQVHILLKNFFAMVQTQFNCTIKIVRTDNGTEFLNKDSTPFLDSTGVIHQTSCVKSPQQNRIAERKHRHFLEKARALRFQSHLPISFLGDCLLTATHVINLLPTMVLKGQNPYQVLFDKSPDSHLRLFGCLCFTSNIGTTDKFASRATKCVFLGYLFGKKGYRVMEIDTKK